MRPNTASVAPAQAGRAPRRSHSTHKSALQDAFLAALANRVDRGGQVTLPVGIVDAGELARVLTALERVQAEGAR
jgi:hypothetical protein